MTKRNLGFWHFAAERACPVSRRVLEGKRTICQVLRPLRARRPAPASTSISMAPSALGGPSLAAFEHLLGDERGSHRRWPAGVERQMGNDFAQFALFEPVVERRYPRDRARPRRRGDRVSRFSERTFSERTFLLRLLTAVIGTERPSRQSPLMSAVEGRPAVPSRYRDGSY